MVATAAVVAATVTLVAVVTLALATGGDQSGAGPGPGGRERASVVPAAGRLSGRVVPRGNGSPSPVPVGLDGCDYNYVSADDGRRVCVPRTPPGGKKADCAYLRSVGIGPLRVVGDDVRELTGAGRRAARGAVLCAR